MLPDLEDLGLEDRNRDGVLDYIRSRIYVENDASAEEIAAAANLAARLAFEVTSMDLPIGFPVSEYKPDRGSSILVGRAASRFKEDEATRFPNIEEVERAALLIGAEDYAFVEEKPDRPHPRNFRLADLPAAARQIVLGPDVSSTTVIDLAARVALESTELRMPLVRVHRAAVDSIPANAILVGLGNPYVQQLVRTGNFTPPRGAGKGCVAHIGPCAVVAGADAAGEEAALQYAALRMPYLSDYGKGRPSLSTIEEEVRRYCSHPKPEPELVFEDSFELTWEVDHARRRIEESLLRVLRPGDAVELDLRISEPAEIRQSLEREIRDLVQGTGADAPSIRILSAHKQGFSWIDEELKPQLKGATRIRIRFRQLEVADTSVDSQDRWLHELYPIDEILARDLGVPTEVVSFEATAPSAANIYEVIAEDAAGEIVLHSTFDPRFVTRPLFDLFPNYADASVATGWLHASVNGAVILEERIKTDYERFWDVYQARVLSQVRDYILRLHGGNPDPEYAPHFEELSVEVELSEPDFRLGIDEERISTLEALHEDIYFETLLFFDVLGTATCGKPLRYPGRIVPRIQPSKAGAGRVRVRFTGYRAPFPQEKPFAEKDPFVVAVMVQAGKPAVTCVEISAGPSFCWLLSAPDTHTIEPRRPTAPIVPWEEPIGPEECDRIIGGLAGFPEVRPFLAGKSWLGRPVWAVEVVSPVEGRYFSVAKASATKPCLFITGRQHANEVSSTSHILKLVELLATDSRHRKLLDRVNIVVQPMTNPDGAALVDELHKVTPDFMLHAGYLGALGVDVTDGQWSDVPRYPEARVRADIWRMWQPDIVLNPHGYPSHEWVQLFAGYTAWLRSRHARLRDWWIPRGWFMPRFDFVDDERFPDHRRAASALRDRIAGAVRQTFGSVNERLYRRYRKYLRCELDLHDGVWIQSPASGCKVDPNSFGFATRHPEITFFEGLSEAPDEVASGEWLQTLAAAGLAFSLVHANFLAELPASVVRARRKEGDALVLRIERRRLPLGS